MENTHGRITVSYRVNSGEKRDIVYSAIREIVGTSYEIYGSNSSFVSTKLVFSLVNSVQTKFYQLCFPLDGDISTEETLTNLLSIAIKNNFHVLYDGEKLNLLSNYLIFGTSKYSLSYYLENYKGIKNSIEKYLKGIGLTISSSFSENYEDKYVYKLGYNQETKRPVVPILNQILLEDYYTLKNGRDFSQQEIDRFFNLDTYIRTLLFPTRIE